MKPSLINIVIIFNLSLNCFGQSKGSTLSTAKNSVEYRSYPTYVKSKNEKWDNFIFELGERISPIAAYEFGGPIVNNGDSMWVHSVELGIGFVRGAFNSWGPWNIGGIWNHITLPYISGEYRWFKNFYESNIEHTRKLRPFMLNIGVGAGCGASFFIFPAGINATAGLSTDFDDLYFKGRVNYDIAWFSFGISGYYNFTSRKTSIYSPNYTSLNLALHIWRNNY